MMNARDLSIELQKLACLGLVSLDLHAFSEEDVRICTRFQYPDGAQVDLFAHADKNDPNNRIEITDYASTVGWLSDTGLNISREKLIHIARMYNTNYSDGAFCKAVPLDSALSGLINVGQACVALAGASIAASLGSIQSEAFVSSYLKEDFFLPSLYEPTTQVVASVHTDARNTFEEKIFEIGHPFRRSAVISRLDNNQIKVDFLIETKNIECAVMVIRQSPRRKIAERWADHAFTTFYDLRESGWGGLCISAFDDISERQTIGINERPIKRLKEFSQIVPISHVSEELPLLMKM